MAVALALALSACPALAMEPPGLRTTIDVTLDPARHRLDGWATIVYRSGADTAFTRLHLHAYPNAFSGPHTIYAEEAARQGEDWGLRFAKPHQLGWMAFDSVSVDGAPARIQVVETIATVLLPRPLEPGDSARVRLRFTVQIPKHFDRFGHTGDAYSIAQWYPKMVVYDEDGWHADPFHYLSEFYGEYGTFDVTVHVPDDYWVGATGVLVAARGGDNEIPIQDRDAPRDSVTVTIRAATADSLAGRWPARALRLETDLARGDAPGLERPVLPETGASLRVPRGAPVHYAYSWEDRDARRDEADGGGRSRPLRLIRAGRDTVITDTLRALAAVAGVRDTLLPSMKALRFRAERVHDFAWVASPDYVRADTTWSGIEIRALSFRDHQEKWADSKRYVVEAMRHHDEAVGPYRYPQFTTAEAWCGGGAMEYPMLIMNEPDIVNGPIRALDDTIAHELAHNWFQGMIGSDERAHPWLDEGFSQWLQDEYTDRKYPEGLFRWARKLPWLAPYRAFTSDEIAYVSRAWARDERPMSTPADQYAGYRDYAVAAYSKPVAMLRALRGLIGREAFGRFLRVYSEENLFRHPRPRDVVRAAAEAADPSKAGAVRSLLREWVETTGRPGFAVDSIRRRWANGWDNEVLVRRTGTLTLPVEVECRFADGRTSRKTVVLDRPLVRLRIPGQSPIVSAVLDPDHDLVEMNRLDNRLGAPPMRWRPLFDLPQSDEIGVLYGPAVWHGEDEGMRLGGWLEGRYLPMRDFPRGVLGFEAGINAGTRNGATAWRLGAWRHAGPLGARGEVRVHGVRDAGLTRFGLRLGNHVTEPGRLHPWRTWWVTAEARDRYDLDPVDARYWSPGATVNLSAGFRIEAVGPRREDAMELEYRRGVSAFGGGDPASDASYDWARISVRRDMGVAGGAFGLSVRGFAGSSWRRVPREQHFDVGEASRLDALARFFDNDRGPLRATDHYLSEGGGGIRGYAGRAGLGRRLATLSVELTHERTGVFVFGDGGRAEASGWGESSRAAGSDLIGRALADAGAGYAYGPVRVALPLWLSRPDPAEPPWKVRWLFSLNLAGVHPWW